MPKICRSYKSYQILTKGGCAMPTPNDRGPHRPRTNIQYHVENGWVVPDQPQTHHGAAAR